mmetsp:Transcript_2859/g.8004  ORF Transcript_2859/g.8004 Transcript_2859/m.8004 type:complete len:136 (+) Transcript_2859:418-825(+)
MKPFKQWKDKAMTLHKASTGTRKIVEKDLILLLFTYGLLKETSQTGRPQNVWDVALEVVACGQGAGAGGDRATRSVRCPSPRWRRSPSSSLMDPPGRPCQRLPQSSLFPSPDFSLARSMHGAPGGSGLPCSDDLD